MKICEKIVLTKFRKILITVKNEEFMDEEFMYGLSCNYFYEIATMAFSNVHSSMFLLHKCSTSIKIFKVFKTIVLVAFFIGWLSMKNARVKILCRTFQSSLKLKCLKILASIAKLQALKFLR